MATLQPFFTTITIKTTSGTGDLGPSLTPVDDGAPTTCLLARGDLDVARTVNGFFLSTSHSSRACARNIAAHTSANRVPCLQELYLVMCVTCKCVYRNLHLAEGDIKCCALERTATRKPRRWSCRFDVLRIDGMAKCITGRDRAAVLKEVMSKRGRKYLVDISCVRSTYKVWHLRKAHARVKLISHYSRSSSIVRDDGRESKRNMG